MDYEKKYNNALDRAKQAIEDCGYNQGRKEMIYGIFPELAESKDERIRKELIKFVSDVKSFAEDGRESWAVREEDIEMCKRFLAYLEKQKEHKPIKNDLDAINLSKILAADRLASAEMTGRLKERNEILENPEKYGLHKSTEWSEEDEKMLEDIIDDYDNGEIMGVSLEKGCWLNSRLKTLRPQPHWKPSEEQMGALEYFIRSWGESGTMSPQNPILCAAKSLYNELKKL